MAAGKLTFLYRTITTEEDTIQLECDLNQLQEWNGQLSGN